VIKQLSIVEELSNRWNIRCCHFDGFFNKMMKVASPWIDYL